MQLLSAVMNWIKSSIAKIRQPRFRALEKLPVGSIIGAIAVFFLAWLTVGPDSFSNANNFAASLVLMAGIIIGVIVIRIPRERYARVFAAHFGWIPVSIGALTYLYWSWWARKFGPVSVSFFDTAAQVLPVLLLAAVVDVRRSATLKSSQLALPIIAVFLGVIQALDDSAFYAAAVKDGTLSHDFAVVASSLTTAIVALIMAVLADRTESEMTLR